MRRILIYLFELIMMFAVFVVCDMPGTIKYAVVALLSILFLLLGRKKKWSAESLICVSLPMIVYLMIGGFTSLINASAYSFTVKIFLFWLIPFLFAFSLYVFYGQDMARIVDVQFLASVLVYLITKGRFILETFTVESMFAYTYGAFFVYYAHKKNWVFCAIAAFGMILTDKRIVIMAVMIAVLMRGILWLFREDKRAALFMWGGTALISNIYLWLVYSGILEAFCKGVGINTNGRVKMYGKVAEWFGGNFLSFGNGLGSVETLLSAWNVEKFSNLHNDLLKFHIELGFWGLLLYFISFGIAFYFIEKKCGNKPMSLFVSMAVYTMMLFSTDNVSIYIIFLLPVYSIYFAVLSANAKEVIEEEHDRKNSQ